MRSDQCERVYAHTARHPTPHTCADLCRAGRGAITHEPVAHVAGVRGGCRARLVAHAYVAPAAPTCRRVVLCNEGGVRAHCDVLILVADGRTETPSLQPRERKGPSLPLRLEAATAAGAGACEIECTLGARRRDEVSETDAHVEPALVVVVVVVAPSWLAIARRRRRAHIQIKWSKREHVTYAASHHGW